MKKEETKKKNSKNGWKRFKRRLTLFIFIVALGSAFYFGYVNLDIPEGHVALVYTKWNEYDEGLLENGKFIWRWERLIPTFMTLHLIPLDIRNTEVTLEGYLPSGDIFLEHAELSGDFHYRLDLFISYRLKPGYIANLVKTQQLQLDELDSYYLQQDQQILNWYLKRTLSEQNLSETLSLEGIIEPDDLLSEFSYLEVYQIHPTYQQLPDIALYQELRNQYILFLENRNDALIDAAVVLAEKEQDRNYRLTILEEYGKLISEYPLLLDFFKIDEGNQLQRYESSDLMPRP